MSSEAFVQNIKRIAVDAVRAEKSSPLIVGKVRTTNPLTVELDNIGILQSSMLSFLTPIVASGTVDNSFNVYVNSVGSSSGVGTATGEITVDVKDESDKKIGTAKGNVSLNVTVSGSATVGGSAVRNGAQTVTSTGTGLQVGDSVALLRYTGGNTFLVLGKIGVA